MNCVSCGHELAASAKFCNKCGARQVPVSASPQVSPTYTTCPDCGHLCPPRAQFCNRCGCKFDEMVPGGTHAPAPPIDDDSAVIVFGNVQDAPAATRPAATKPVPEPARSSTSLSTGASMAAGSGTSSGANSGDWLLDAFDAPSATTTPQPAASAPSQPLRAPAPALPPLFEEQHASSGGRAWPIVAALAVVAVLAGGGWWWWSGHNSVAAAGTDVARPAAEAPAEPAGPPAAVPASTTLAPNEALDAAAPAVEAVQPVTIPDTSVAPVVPVAESPPAPAAIVQGQDAGTPAAASRPAAAPRARQPARKKSLDDLLD